VRELYDQAVQLPDLDVLAIDILTRLFGRLLIVVALDNFRRPMDVACTIREIDAITRQRDAVN
jgi:hypothetical protein